MAGRYFSGPIIANRFPKKDELLNITQRLAVRPDISFSPTLMNDKPSYCNTAHHETYFRVKFYYVAQRCGYCLVIKNVYAIYNEIWNCEIAYDLKGFEKASEWDI